MACTVNIEPITGSLQTTSPIHPTSPIPANSDTPKILLSSIAKCSSVDSKMTYVEETQNLTDEECVENATIDAGKVIEKGMIEYLKVSFELTMSRLVLVFLVF